MLILLSVRESYASGNMAHCSSEERDPAQVPAKYINIITEDLKRSESAELVVLTTFPN